MIPNRIILLVNPKPKNPIVSDFIMGAIKLNPEFEFVFIEDENLFIKNLFPHDYDKFMAITTKIQKLDLLKLYAIYYYGGWYFDTDIEMLDSIANRVRLQDRIQLVFFEEETISYEIFKSEQESGRYQDISHKYGRPFVRYANCAVAASRGNEFIRYIIDRMYDVIETKNSAPADQFEYWIYNTTGPDKITECIRNLPLMVDDVHFVASSLDTVRQDSKLPYPLMIGNFGRHWCHGSWKHDKTI